MDSADSPSSDHPGDPSVHLGDPVDPAHGEDERPTTRTDHAGGVVSGASSPPPTAAAPAAVDPDGDDWVRA